MDPIADPAHSADPGVSASFSAPTPTTSAPLLTARELCRRYRVRASPFSPAREITALDRVSFTVLHGERLGVVGESGAGKSTLARVLLALEPPDSGHIGFGPEQWRVRPGSARRTRWFRARVQLVPQDPAGSLNPRLRVGRSIAEPLACLGIDVDHQRRVDEVLAAVGLDAEMADRYPHEFSGGQRQRLAIARAIAPDPCLLIADEPVSALDVSARGRVLDLLRHLSDERGCGLVLISHDLGVVRSLCERVLVMREGHVVEQGTVTDVLSAPSHPYTRSLVESIPRLPGPEPTPHVDAIGGSPGSTP